MKNSQRREAPATSEHAMTDDTARTNKQTQPNPIWYSKL